MKQTYSSLRWILLAAGILAILGLTGMNIYSLYALRDNTAEAELENKKLQVSEFSDKARHRFFSPFYGLSSLDMHHLQTTFRNYQSFPSEALNIFRAASQDSIFQKIYFIPAGSGACREASNSSILRYDQVQQTFVESHDYPSLVCDGMGIARTRMKVLITDYRYNNKVIFDTHRSMTIAMVNLDDRSIIGYLTMPINQEYMISRYLQPQLIKKFGHDSKQEMTVWLRDWTKEKVLASSKPEAEFDRNKIQFTQRFPDLFDDWLLAVALPNTPDIATFDASLIKSMIVLGAAFFLLLGTLVFLFLIAQREQALARRQASFLANVSHELKTPLAVMQAAGENLADGRVEDKRRLQAYGNHIFAEAIRLRKMIEKLLDAARAEDHESLIEPKPVLLKGLVEDYLNDHQAYLESEGFTVKTAFPESLPFAMVDSKCFQVILGNLVDNAIKYSKEDKHLHFSLSQQEKLIQLTVEDHGVGIPKKSLKHIFDRFYRVEDTLTAQTKGHGLGLAITKKLVEHNGGSISVESEVGKGTTFFVSFPVFMNRETQSKEYTTAEHRTTQFTSDSPEYVG